MAGNCLHGRVCGTREDEKRIETYVFFINSFENSSKYSKCQCLDSQTNGAEQNEQN